MYIIGRGGFGKVWKVRLRKTNELFALKEMSKVKIIDRRSEISIMSERKLLSSLNHPFLVNMHFAFQDFYNLYLVMDLLTGGDLRYHIAHKKTFSENQTKFIIANIILALEYIHNKNIIHRDIKPENLVLESTGYVRVTDFGVAKINEEDNSSETSGTPGYMAPEVILVQNHSFPSDFFALGVIGYEFMIGKRPYLGVGRKEIKQLIISRQAKLKEEDIPENWSKDSAEFINSLLQRKPKKRLGYCGIKEIKDHPWMKNIEWDILKEKKLEAPFIPPLSEQNYDKKYCEGNDKVGEETIGRYELYLQSDLYGGVFVNYTYINLEFISKYNNEDKNKNKKFRINSSINSNKNKIILNKNKNKRNTNNINSNNNSNSKKINNENNNNIIKNNNNREIKNYSNKTINSASIRKNAFSQKNIKNNNINNNNAIININKNYLSNDIDKFNILNNIPKYNTPMVNENIMCNNYINLNFNNCKNDQNIDVSTIKKIISNNINDLKQNMKNKNNNNNFNNNINYMKNRNEKNIININNKKEKERISVNKAPTSKYTLYKSSSMKSMGSYNEPVLIKSNNNINNNIKSSSLFKNKNKGNNKQKGSISINKTNLCNNNNDLKININNFNNNNKKNIIYPLSASNYSNHKTINTNLNPNHNHHIFSRGKSEYNLKIETNDMNFLSLYNNHRKNKNKIGDKSFAKTASCDRIFMGSAKSHHNHIKNKNIKKNFNNDKIKNDINFDKKLMSWIHKNFKNGKNKKINYNNFNSNNKNNGNNNNINKVKYSRQGSFLNFNDNIINYLDNNNGIIKNKNFPSINSINSINITKSPIKKILELNAINTNSRQMKSNRSNFNTINLMTSMAKTQSMKNIYNKKKISKLTRMLSQKQIFSGLSNKQKKSKMSKKLSTKNLFNSEEYFNNYNLNYKPRNLKIESTSNGYELKNDKQINFEYIKSV